MWFIIALILFALWIVGLVSTWAIGAFVMLKQGFVRHDGHSATFFFAAALAGAALARGGIARIAGAGIAVVASIWALAAFGVHASALFQYADRLDGTAADGRHWHRSTAGWPVHRPRETR